MKLFTAAAVALGLTGAALAEDTSRNDELLTSLNQDTIRFISESLDHTVRRDLEDDVGVLAVYTDDTAGDELIYAIQGKVCQDGPDCLGAEIYVIYNGDFTAEQANAINKRWAAIKAAVTDGDLYLTRYLILDNGQTIGNIRTNLLNALAIAEQVGNEYGGEEEESSETVAASDLQWGDDSGNYANDDACDDARFHSDGDDWSYQRSHVLRDATDCRTLYEAGSIQLYLDFGDNSGTYADDDTCDDNRFTGEGRSILTTDSHVKIDSADCIAAYREGNLNRP